jgi:hypothetical protein
MILGYSLENGRLLSLQRQCFQTKERANTACTGQVRAFRRTFREAAPSGGFGVWWLYPPNPALAGNALPLGSLTS